MKKFQFLLILLLPIYCFAQKTTIYNYQDKGDTAYYNSKKLVPGDTLHLGYGSNQDKSFNYIWEMPTGKLNGAADKYVYLTKNYSNGFLLYYGRVDQGFGMMKLYLPVFYDPNNKNVKYNVLFLRAIETVEIKGFNSSYGKQ